MVNIIPDESQHVVRSESKHADGGFYLKAPHR